MVTRITGSPTGCLEFGTFQNTNLLLYPRPTYNQASLVRYGKTALAERHIAVKKCQKQDTVCRYELRDEA